MKFEILKKKNTTTTLNKMNKSFLFLTEIWRVWNYFFCLRRLYNEIQKEDCISLVFRFIIASKANTTSILFLHFEIYVCVSHFY